MKKITHHLLGIMLLACSFISTITAAPLLASTPVGFMANAWWGTFGLKLTQLSITSGDEYTRVVSSLPSSIIQPENTKYQVDPSVSPTGPIAIATRGTSVNGKINVTYTVSIFSGDPQNPVWTGQPVTATVPLAIVNGQLQYNPNPTPSSSADTTCTVNAFFNENNNPYIQLVCWYNAPPSSSLPLG